MLLMLFSLTQAFAQSPSLAVLDSACADKAALCDTILTAVKFQVQRQLAGIDIDPLPSGQWTPTLVSQSIEPQCELGACEKQIAALIGVRWIINGNLNDKTGSFEMAIYEASQEKPLIETVLKAVDDDKVEARTETAVSTLLSVIIPDTSHEIGALFANVPSSMMGEGTLIVDTDPPGIAFLLDGEQRITTPYQAQVPAGVHTLQIDDPCHWSKENRFLVSNGERLIKSIPIMEKKANLDVLIKDAIDDSPKYKARVIVDNKQLGHTPFRQAINVCSKEIVLRTETRFWSRELSLNDGQYETHWINLDEMDIVVEESDGKWAWGCSEKYTVAALATLGGGLTLGAIARSPMIASIALASGPVYYFGRWSCEAKASASPSSQENELTPNAAEDFQQ